MAVGSAFAPNGESPRTDPSTPNEGAGRELAAGGTV